MKKEFNNLFLPSKLKWARIVCESNGFSLQIKNTIKGPSTDGNNIYMPSYNSSWIANSKEAIKWEMGLLHEIYHNKHKADFVMLQRLKLPKGITFRVVNRVLDHNIERCEYGNFRGRDNIMDMGRDYMSKETVAYIKGLDFTTLDEVQKKLIALDIFDHEIRKLWSNADPLIHIIKYLDEETNKWVTKLLTNTMLANEYMEPRPAGDSNFTLARRIMEELELKDIFDEETNKGKGWGEGTDSTGEKKDVNGTVISKHEKYYNQNDEKSSTSHDHSEYVFDQGKLLKIHYSTKDLSPASYVMSTPNIIYSKNETSSSGNGWRDSSEYYSRIKEASQNQLPKKIKKELRVLSKCKYIGNKRNGRLNKKQISQVATNISNKVFQQKINKNILNTAITLLIDNSGSMGGDPYVHASASGVMMAECFQQLGVPTEIIGFTSAGSTAVFIIHKEFNEKVDKESIINRFSNTAKHMASNPDGEAIVYAADRLIKRKEKKKLLFVISDGSPAFYQAQGFSVPAHTKFVIEGLEKSPYIDIYGIGIMDNNPAKFYKKHIIIDKACYLETEIFKLMRKTILS